MSKRGKYIVLEGIDGSGKTTQIQNLLNHLGGNTLLIREPGGTPISEKIRELLKNKDLERSAHTNMFLFSAARASLIDDVIRPAINQGKNVLSDRNWLSTVAYQSAEGADVSAILELSRLATGEFFDPDLLILIDVPAEVSQARLKSRAGSEADYFDLKGQQYFDSVRQAYLDNVKKVKNHAIINGDQTPDAVWQHVKNAIERINL